MTRDDLLESLLAAAKADPAVEALLLTGSLGAGTADAFSDIDALLVVAPAETARFADQLEGWMTRVADLVLWRRLFPGQAVFSSVTRDWLRLDVSVVEPARLSGSQATLRPLWDPQGLYAALPDRLPERRPDPDRVAQLIEEFFRILGLMPVVLGREEYVVGVTGIGLIRGLLIQLLIEQQAPAKPPGALHLRRLLPQDQIAALEALPAVAATRDSIITANLACAMAFLPRARRLAAAIGVPWPDALEAAARDHLRRELGLELPISRA